MSLADLWELPSGYDRPTRYALKMQAAEQGRDFAEACRLAASQAAAVARETRRQSEATGTPACWEYWEEIEREAKRALGHWRNGQDLPLSVVVKRLCDDGLALWADALTGVVSWSELVF